MPKQKLPKVVREELIAQGFKPDEVDLIRDIIASFDYTLINISDELLERLAAIEHYQWVSWSQEIARKEALSPELITRWATFWVPYPQLAEYIKEMDRKYARKVVEILQKHSKEVSK